MASRRKRKDDDKPQEILMPMDPSEEAGPTEHAGRQRSARNDPVMRDGDGSVGSPGWDAVDDVGTDTDVGDELEGEPPYSGMSGGSVGGTPAEKRAKGGRKH